MWNYYWNRNSIVQFDGMLAGNAVGPRDHLYPLASTLWILEPLWTDGAGFGTRSINDSSSWGRTWKTRHPRTGMIRLIGDARSYSLLLGLTRSYSDHIGNDRFSVYGFRGWCWVIWRFVKNLPAAVWYLEMELRI